MHSRSYHNEFDRHLGARSTSTPLRPALSAFHGALLEFVTISSRLLFVQDPNIYEDFQHDNDAFNEYSPSELCEIMLQKVLPSLNAYQLPSRMKRRLKLLDLHPSFQKTQHGYKYLPDRIGAQFVLQPRYDYSLREELPTLLEAQGSGTARSTVQRGALIRPERGSQTLLLEGNARLNYQLSLDLASLLSAMFSSDSELSSNGLHNASQTKKCLQRAKQNFQKSGNMLPYREDIDGVVNTIELFEELKTHLKRSLLKL